MKPAALCVFPDQTRTSTSSLVPSCCVVTVTSRRVCLKRQRRRSLLESNLRFSSLSATCWTLRRRRRISSMNTGDRLSFQGRSYKTQTPQKLTEFGCCCCCVSDIPSVPSMPSQVRLHWTTGNPRERRRSPAEAPGRGPFTPLSFRSPKPNSGQLGKRLVLTDSSNNEERTVQALSTRLWAVWLPQTRQCSALVTPTEPKAGARHRVWRPHLTLLPWKTSLWCCLFGFEFPVVTSSDWSACQYYFIFISFFAVVTYLKHTGCVTLLLYPWKGTLNCI